MNKSRCGKMQSLEKKNLARGRGEQINTAHNLVNMHQPIIDDNCKLIGKNPIGAAHNKVAHCLLNLLADRAGEQVSEGHDAVIIDAKTQGGAATLVQILTPPGLAQLAAGAR